MIYDFLNAQLFTFKLWGSKSVEVTLFSAPNYCGEFDNAGAMMTALHSSQIERWICLFPEINTMLFLIMEFRSFHCD